MAGVGRAGSGEILPFDFETCRDREVAGSEKWIDRTDAQRAAGIVPLSVADMEFVVAPCIRSAVEQACEWGAWGYTKADERYLSAICGWQRARHGWDVRPEWVVTGCGVVDALKVAIRALTEPGDAVCVMTPVYYPFSGVVRQTGRSLANCPLVMDSEGRYRMDFDGLGRLLAERDVRLLLLCNPHNPVGRVWERDELARLSELCLAHGVIVVSDEIHGDLLLGDVPLTPYATLSDEAAATCVTCAAPSKTFNIAGLQSSYAIICDEGLRRRFAQEARLTTPFGIPYLARAATIAAYEQGGPWLDALLEVIRANERLLRETLAECLPQVTCYQPEGTYLAWNDWRALGLGPERLEAFLRDEALLALDAGSMFGEGGEGFERWNLALPTRELERALARLVDAARVRGLAS